MDETENGIKIVAKTIKILGLLLALRGCVSTVNDVKTVRNVKYIEPTCVEKSDLYKIEEPYKVDEAMKLFDDMVARKGYGDYRNDFFSLAPEVKAEITAEVAGYLSRLENNRHKLAKSYAQYYYETDQKVPEVITRTMTNKTGYTSDKYSFKNKYETEDLYQDLAKLSFIKGKNVEDKLLGDKSTKLKDNSAYIKLKDLHGADAINQVHETIKQSSKFLSNKQTGTPDMCAGLLMESLNRDVLNNILTNCSEMGIDVLQLFDAEKRQAIQNQHQIQEDGNNLSIDGVNYIFPGETTPIQTIDGPEMGM